MRKSRMRIKRYYWLSHCLHISYKHYKEILLYSNKSAFSFEDAEANLLSKEKFNLEVCARKGEGLSVRGESFNKGSTSKSKFGRRKSNMSCHYCRKPRHVISECFKLKTRGSKKKISHIHTLMNLLKLHLSNLILIMMFYLLSH